jgi:hypothetical protein
MYSELNYHNYKFHNWYKVSDTEKNNKLEGHKNKFKKMFERRLISIDTVRDSWELCLGNSC